VHEFEQFVNDGPLLDTPEGFLPFLERHIFNCIEAEVDILEHYCRDPQVVVLTRHMASFGASIVHERRAVPLVTVFAFAAQASAFNLWTDFFRAVLADRVNSIRGTFGLSPVTDWRAWLTSSDLFLACWPDWFSPRRASWPHGVRHLGFLQNDEIESGQVPTSVGRMLDSSPSPVLITGGTSVWRMAKQFYSVAAAACEAIHRPAILVCRHEPLISSPIPPGIICCRELPFASVMPSSPWCKSRFVNQNF